MAISVTTTAYGDPAHDTLAAEIAAAKDGDPLAPVGVIVPSNYTGIAARRALGRAGGVAAVTFLTVYRLAELLGAGRVAAAGRRPVSTPVLAGAVRAVLDDDPGHFVGVHTHPATERSLVRAHRALSEVGPAGLDRLAATSARAGDVVRVHQAIEVGLADRFSAEQDLVTAAVAAIGDGVPVLDELGPVLVFLPQRLTSSQLRLLAAIGEAVETTIIVGDSGDAAADEPVRAAIGRLGVDVPPPAAARPCADRAISVSDADDEVRHALREIVDAARNGVTLGRTAILYGTPDPYARLVADALDGAGIEWFGASVRTAEASLLGRSLLDLLALADHDFSRHDVAAWLAGAPVRGVDNRPAPVAAWERASRAAGVAHGIEQWRTRLARLADDLDAEAVAEETDEETVWRAERTRREAGHARHLADFVVGLADALDPGGRGGSWSGLASWCRGLVRRYLGGETLRGAWPDDEQRAAQRVDAAVDRLGDLDGVDPRPSVAAFRRALELELADDLGRHGTFGHGVLVGPVALGVGLELDRVVVLGLAEGSLPARRRDDPLLPDRERRVVGPDLPLRAERLADDHRSLLAVLAAAASSTFLFPRGDLRRSAERAPSRWLLDAAEAHDGRRPAADELAGSGDWFREVPSFVAGLRSTGFPAHDQEHDVRVLLDAHDRGDHIVHHPLLDTRVELRRGVDLVTARRSDRFTRFDGNLAAGDLRGTQLTVPTDPGAVVSATRLETWASCPHAYFSRYVLGVAPVEDPEEHHTITPLDLGSLVHATLDGWLREALDAGAVPAPGTAWPETWRARLQEIAGGLADALEARGQTGRRLYWQRDRRRLLHDLDRFLAFDDARRATDRITPLASELAFGMPGGGDPPIDVALGDGRSVRLRGSIDRVDERSDGGLVVIDYKTGSTRAYVGLSEDDPAPGGVHLQLVLYAAAARVALGRPDAPVHGAYWFVSSKGKFVPLGYDVTPSVEATVLGTVARIVDGIAAGRFPPHPVEPRWLPFVPCHHCDPDGLGTRHQHRDWLRKRTDPALAPYLAVAEPDLLTMSAAAVHPDGRREP